MLSRDNSPAQPIKNWREWGTIWTFSISVPKKEKLRKTPKIRHRIPRVALCSFKAGHDPTKLTDIKIAATFMREKWPLPSSQMYSRVQSTSVWYRTATKTCVSTLTHWTIALPLRFNSSVSAWQELKYIGTVYFQNFRQASPVHRLFQEVIALFKHDSQYK